MWSLQQLTEYMWSLIFIYLELYKIKQIKSKQKSKNIRKRKKNCEGYVRLSLLYTGKLPVSWEENSAQHGPVIRLQRLLHGDSHFMVLGCHWCVGILQWSSWLWRNSVKPKYLKPKYERSRCRCWILIMGLVISMAMTLCECVTNRTVINYTHMVFYVYKLHPA